MKTRLVLLLLLLGARSAFPALPVAGPMTYTQNFNSLPSTTPVNWTDNVTLPGWWLHRDGAAPPAATIQISNGNTAAWTANLYSLGATGITERALGCSPTTAHGNYSFIVIFQNTTGNPIKLTNVKYDVEVYRTNTTAGIAETTQFSKRIAATQAEITSALATGWTADTTLDYVYPGQTAVGVARPPDVANVSRAPASETIIPPNQHLALRWTNPNDGGSDAYMGIDNVEIQFTQPGCSVTATTSGVARDQNGTPGNPNDDTFSFNITVNGFGTGTQGWQSASTGTTVTGSYGVSKAVTGVPIASSPLNFVVTDVTFPACSASVTVTAPQLDLFLTNTDGFVLSFTDAPLNATSHVRTGLSTEPGFAGGTATAKVQFQPAPNNTAKYFDINNARPNFTTEAVNISNVSEFVVGIDLAAYTTSDTTFETPDTLTVSVQTATSAAGPWTNLNPPILNATDGAVLFNQIKVSDPGTGYGALAYPAANFPFVRFHSGARPRGAATYVRLSTTGGNDSASEHLLFDNITFSSPHCAIIVSQKTTRNNHLDDVLANDEFMVSAIIKAELNQGSTGWVSNISPPSGGYDPVNATSFGPFPVTGGPVTVTFTDNVDPTCSTTVTFTPPPTVLTTDIISMLRHENGTLTLNDDQISFTLTMAAQYGGTGWTSNIPIPDALGTYYSGNYLDIYPIVADIATLPEVPLIKDKADPTATISVAYSIPQPLVYVMGDFLRVGAAAALVPSVPYPPSQFQIPNAWKNLANGILTLNDASDPTILQRTVDSELVFDESSGPAVGQVDVTAELVVTDTSPTSNFETNDTFKAVVVWYSQGLNKSQNMVDVHDPNGNEWINGYTDTAAAPYNNNRLLDEFNRPAPGLPLSGLITRTIPLSATIPADAELAIFSIEGFNDSSTETFRLQNVHFVEKGANPNSDSDGDGITDANEDIMGTDKYNPLSVLRLVPTPGNPTQFTFSGIGGRFYRVYVSDDNDGNTHLRKWVDAGLPTMQDLGPHTVNLPVDPGVPRRYLRVHVMQSNGTWPPVSQ